MPTHPEIFATLEHTITEDAVKTLASDLSEALGSDRLLDYEGMDVIVLESKRYYALFPDSLPRAESVLHVRPSTPYYEKGYERGNWPEIAAILEFLRHRVPEARVWYGPDGTEQVEEITRESLERLWSYWSQYGNRPYYEKRPGGS
jgi:hypothetical protein